ncbi:MAG TPA: hypothetical protein PLF32_03010 [Bacteroidales bacterium]|nr:hypothetical protein [Bacteroidales bacterium]HOR81609.1 hypothetical protein [Bacteroidales bacterium]HPJ90315.1 hypothetical protein [Bacteroidales bacterium]HQB20304.1 hypothetical protein [Bacteroidales bacterium]
MKKLNFAVAFIIVIFFTACEKPTHLKSDCIVFQKINKTITVSQNDTILNDVIFTVTGNDTDGIHAYVYRVGEQLLIGNGSNDFLFNEDKIIVLNHNDIIASTSIGTWGNKEKLYIDDFAGKGEKYIGFRLGLSYPPFSCFYYWIKISLSADKKTLKIISMAHNNMEDNPILAGQIK